MTSWTLWAVTLVAQADTEFRPVGPGDIDTEKLPATPFVFAAYALVWIAAIGYVLTLWRRVRKTEREIVVMAARLESIGHRQG